MKYLFLVLLMIGCSNREADKIHFQDQVEVTCGFYKGASGTVRHLVGSEYGVDSTETYGILWVKKECLELSLVQKLRNSGYTVECEK